VSESRLNRPRIVQVEYDAMEALERGKLVDATAAAPHVVAAKAEGAGGQQPNAGAGAGEEDAFQDRMAQRRAPCGGGLENFGSAAKIDSIRPVRFITDSSRV
jgi:hypothetical protein